MDFDLTREQQNVVERARALAEEHLRPGAAARDRSEAFPVEESRILARARLMGVAIPEELGGMGGGPIEYALAIHEIAAGCAACAVTMAVTNMTAEMIHRFGTEAQHRRWLPRVCAGDRPVASFMLSEPHCGSDAAALRTRAVPLEGGGWVLNGSKMWVTNGGHCDAALVMARTAEHRSRGISAFIVDRDARGYIAARAEDKMGLRASNTAEISFEECHLPDYALLGAEGEGFKVAMVALDGGRIGIGAQALGIARSALRAAREQIGAHVSPRRSRLLEEAQTRFDAAWLMVLRGAWLRAGKKPMTLQAAMTKVYATEVAGQVCELAMKAVGGEAAAARADVERHVRDVRVTRIYEGTSEIQRMVIARELQRQEAA